MRVSSGSCVTLPEPHHDLQATIGTPWTNLLSAFGFPFAAFGLLGRPVGFRCRLLAFLVVSFAVPLAPLGLLDCPRGSHWGLLVTSVIS